MFLAKRLGTDLIKMIKTILLLIIGKLYIFQNYVSVSALTNVTTDRPTVYLELTLLNYTLEYCGGIEWCSIRAGYSHGNDYFTSCCGTCACDKTCLNRGDCCPDFEFMYATQSRGFDNISDFITAFEKWSKERQPSMFSSATDTPENDQLCIRAQVIRPSVDTEMNPSYYMTSTCNDNSTVYRNRCEYDSLPDNSSFSLNDFVPVQLPENGIIYRNKHCAECNAVPSPVRSWLVTVICAHEQVPTFYSEYFDNPLVIINKIFSKKRKESNFYPLCNIVFEPENKNSTTKRHSCINVDINKCEDTKPDPEITRMCNHLSSPIYLIDKDKQLKTFKNVACIKCQNESAFDTECLLKKLNNKIGMTLNIPNEMHGIDIENATTSDSLNIIFPDSYVLGCQSGEMFDSYAEKCRKVYCPRGMFAMNGVCQYMFTKISNGVFLAYLNVTLNTTEIYDSRLVLSLYEQLSRQGSDLFKIEDLSIWSNENSEYVIFIAIYVRDYFEAIEFFGNLVEKPLKLKLEDNVVKCILSLTDSVKRRFREVVDSNRKTIYKLAYPKMWRPKRLPVKFYVRESNFCYRVELLKDEYHIGNMGEAVKYEYRKQFIWDWDPWVKLDKSERTILVCYHHVINPDSFRTGTAGSRDESWLHSVGYNIIIIPVLIAVTLIASVVIYIIRNERRKTTLKQPSIAVAHISL